LAVPGHLFRGSVPAIPTGTGRENCATDRGDGGCGDGRDKPGHDVEESVCLTHPLILTPMGVDPAIPARPVLPGWPGQPPGQAPGGKADRP